MTPPRRVPLLCVLLLAPAAVAQEEPESWIHYDAVVDGRLVGGRLRPDPTNPLHVPIPTAEGAPASHVETIVDNGPSANRLDIVVVGDGYQVGELPAYADHVDAVVAGFFSEQPFAEYANFFNVHRVDVVSVDSGVDNDPTLGVMKDTALDMEFWCSGVERLLCVDLAKAQAQATQAPAVDQTWAVANSTKYGGAGFSDLCTLASSNFWAVDLALHEFGHSFGGLADEYWTAGTTYAGSEPTQPNVTTLDEAALLAQKRKWFRWIGAAPGVGAFQGGLYVEFGIYRPTDDSLMRSLGRPYEEVNAQELITELYRFVSPIDDSTPEGVVPPDAVLSVTPLHPVGHLLDVQWSVDGVDVPGATADTLDLATLGLAPGVHDVSVEVVDGTPWVMKPAVRRNRMTATRSWTVAEPASLSPYGCGINPAGSLVHVSGAPTPGGTVTLGVANPAGFHPPGSIALLGVALAPAPGFPCGPLLPGYGMTPGQPGELLLSPSLRVGPFLKALYAGPGTTTPFPLAIPGDPTLLGLSLFAQGVLWDPAATNGVRFGLAEATELRIGS